MNGKNLELCWNLFFMLFKNEQHLSLSGTFCFILMLITVPEFNVKCNVNSMLYSSINDHILFFMPSVIVWFILLNIFRSSSSEVFFRKTVLKIWSRFTIEHPCRSAISIRLQSNFIEIAFRHGCSQVNLEHIFRKTFYKNTSGRLFLALGLSSNAFLPSTSSSQCFCPMCLLKSALTFIWTLEDEIQ